MTATAALLLIGAWLISALVLQPSTEPLPTGTTLLLPVYRSTTPPPGWNAASGAGFSSLHAAAGGGVDLSAGPALDACC